MKNKALFALLAVGCFQLLSMQAHAVLPEFVCTPQNQIPGSHCVAPTPTEWVFRADLGYGRYLSPLEWDSLDSIVSAIEALWLADTGASWCSMPLMGINMDVVAPAYQAGIDIVHWHVANFDVALRTYENPPCAQTLAYQPLITQTREIICPTGYTLIREESPVVIGPYCALPWTNIDPLKCSGCIKGSKTVGNPIDIGSANKHQVETDYRASGVSPLRFTRHYNSVIAKNIGIHGAVPKNVIGRGWTADYFQRIRFFSEGAIKTAFAFRPDGQRLPFNESGTSFVGMPDADFALTAQRNGSGVITGWVLKTSSDAIETYDALGTLLSIQHRSGITETLAYSSGVLSSVTDSFGRSLQFTFSNGRLASVIQPDGLPIYFGYNSNTELTTATDATGMVRTYHYGTFDSHLTGITDESAQRYTTYGYNGYTSFPESTELAGGVNKYTVGYYANGSAIVTDPLNVTRLYHFETKGNVRRLASVPSTCEGCGIDKSFTYDDNGNVLSRRDFNDNLTCHAYDTGRNLETARVEGLAPSVASCPASLASYAPVSGTRERKVVFTWHPTSRVPASITESNRSTTFTHDANGNVLTRTVTDTSVTPNVSRTWTYTYNSFGQALSEDGPRTDVSDVTTYVYYTCATGNQCGQLNTITNAAGDVTTYDAYNVHGQPTQMTDANGLVTGFAYDARRRLTHRCTGATLPGCTGGELTHLIYWPTGLLKKVTNPDGSFIEYTYDAAHRLTEIKDGALNKIVYTLDVMGNRTAENIYDPSFVLKRTHSRVFNTLNQLWKDVNAAGTVNVTTTFGYDNNGNQTTTNAPLSRNSSSLYDELNRLQQITDPASGNTLFGYDADDNLTSVTDPRTLVTSYTYTGFGDLKTQVSPDTGTTTNTYDSGGNLKTSTDARNAITTYTYDTLNRVTSAAFKIGSNTDQTITYTYDAGANGKGHLTGASDGSHSMAWNYDVQGRLIGKGQVVGAVTKSIGYGYNAQGQLASTALPSGRIITYGYNANGQVTNVTLQGTPNVTILNNITYDPFGPITGWTWGNGTASTSRTFDTDGKLTALSSTPTVVGNRTFGYDDAFRITSTTDSGGPAWTLGYDNLDRLNSASKTGTTIGYTYDANGNRLTQTGTSASTYTVAGTSNRLSSTTGSLARTYTHNAAGSVLTSGVATHTYYNSGRMKTGKLGSASTTTYIYNALGQRIRKSGGTPGTVIFMYDEAGHLVGEYNSTGVLVQETVWLGDIPVATLRPNGANVTVFYVHTDQLNTPRKVTTNATNPALRWKWDPSPFGDGGGLNENPSGAGSFKYHLRFPGQYFDLETNLHYNYFRDYDPAAGRYVESDPIGLQGGLSTYSYVGGAPVQFADPQGLLMGPAPASAAAVANPIGAVACAVGCPVLAYAWYQINASKIQDVLADALPSDAEKESRRLLQEEIEREANRREYKARCDQPPPPGLDPCEQAKWLLKRARDCKSLRRANTDRWWGGQDTRHNPQLFTDLDNAIRNAEQRVRQLCGQDCE